MFFYAAIALLLASGIIPTLALPFSLSPVKPVDGTLDPWVNTGIFKPANDPFGSASKLSTRNDSDANSGALGLPDHDPVAPSFDWSKIIQTRRAEDHDQLRAPAVSVLPSYYNAHQGRPPFGFQNGPPPVVNKPAGSYAVP